MANLCSTREIQETRLEHFLGHKGAVWGTTLTNKDATKTATAAADITVCDAVSGDEWMTLAHQHIVKTVKFTQDSSYLLTGHRINIHDLKNLKQNLRKLMLTLPVLKRLLVQ